MSQVAMNGGEKKGSGTGKKLGVTTLRFDLELAPPNDQTTNEFSYVHLVREKEAKVSRLAGGVRGVAWLGVKRVCCLLLCDCSLPNEK